MSSVLVVGESFVRRIRSYLCSERRYQAYYAQATPLTDTSYPRCRLKREV